MTKKTEQTVTTIRMPSELLHRMQRLHARDGIPSAEQVRRALDEFLTKKKIYSPSAAKKRGTK